jgi:glutamate-1-semialdehyde 2,1-aminomutase
MLAGTFNGGSYAMSIASAVLDILTPLEQARIERLSDGLADACREIIHRYSLPAHIVNLGNKGCIFVQNNSSTAVHNYREFAHHSNRVIEQVLPVYFQNRNVWIQWKDEWTISAQHSQEDIDIFVSTFESFAALWAKNISLEKP